MSSIFSDYTGLKSQINRGKLSAKFPNNVSYNVREVIRKNFKYFKLNENETTTFQKFVGYHH